MIEDLQPGERLRRVRDPCEDRSRRRGPSLSCLSPSVGTGPGPEAVRCAGRRPRAPRRGRTLRRRRDTRARSKSETSTARRSLPCAGSTEWTSTRWVTSTNPSLPDRLNLIAEVSDTLAGLHDLDLVHGDVTPSNILVTLDPELTWRPFVIDPLRRAEARTGKDSRRSTAQPATPLPSSMGAPARPRPPISATLGQVLRLVLSRDVSSAGHLALEFVVATATSDTPDARFATCPGSAMPSAELPAFSTNLRHRWASCHCPERRSPVWSSQPDSSAGQRAGTGGRLLLQRLPLFCHLPLLHHLRLGIIRERHRGCRLHRARSPTATSRLRPPSPRFGRTRKHNRWVQYLTLCGRRTRRRSWSTARSLPSGRSGRVDHT